MKAKRFLSWLLILALSLGLTTMPISAQTADEITAFLTVSQYGEFLADKNGAPVAAAPVTMSGKDTYTLDDAFRAFHETYLESDAYASATGDWGAYVAKFAGDESGNFSYQVNGATEAVMGISHEVEDGDYIDFSINRNLYPDTESYTKFSSYTLNAFVGEENTLTLSEASYDENYNMVFSPCADAAVTINGEKSDLTTDENGSVALTFDSEGKYIVSASKQKEVEGQSVTAITAPICVVTVTEKPKTLITVPSDAKLFVGEKGKIHFVRFTELEPVSTVTDGDNTTYSFELNKNATYNYRVSGENYVTYGGTFKNTEDFSLSVTRASLAPSGKTKTTVDRDGTSNNGYNVADIYLNINPQGYLKLSSGDTFQTVSLRNWEAVNSTTANYFIEPDFHFEVIDENGKASDVVEIDENGVLTAKKSGTAIVLATYDAMTLNFGADDEFYGAIYPENTGVFVVSVDAKDSGIQTGMTLNDGKNSSETKLSGDFIDSELDCIYFVGENGEYTFKPTTDGTSVYIANPTVGEKLTYSGFKAVAANADASFTVPLTQGRNIVKTEKDGKAEYQVITAKQVSVTVNNNEPVHPGDNLSIVFDKLYHPANKLAGVYNMSANAVYTDVSGYDGKVVGALSAQYNFANNADAQTVSSVLAEKNVWGAINYVKDADLVVPSDYAYDTFTLSGGALYASGWGDSYGNHRAITYENGKGANLNADAKLGYFGTLPDIEIPITVTDAAVSSLKIDSENAKSDYLAGDKFDTSSVTVTAVYDDSKEQIITNYTVSPEVITADTEKVTITYKGVSADFPITVSSPKVTAIEISAAPTKTVYTEGEHFNPSGMVVTATYENGAKKATADYSYAPTRELETTDTQMTVSYIGENAAENIASVSQPITVKEKSSGSGSGSGSSSDSSKISVYFTLLGDKKHGTPSDKSETHTKKKNNLETWVSKTKITLDKGSYVIDAVEKALSLNGIAYECDDNYISEIKGLSEFDNGDLSGWMYTLNGKYPSKGVAEQTLKNGDAIIFHYTDDYTAENTGHSSGSGSGGSSGGGSASISASASPTPTTAPTTAPTAAPDTEKENKSDNGVIKNPDGDVALKTDFSEKTYNDVNADDWYYGSVKYAYEKNLMSGTGEGFEPFGDLTRAMLVTVLWRMENMPLSDYELTFTDVSDGDWYCGAVKWAASEEITSGISTDKFGAYDAVTREQAAALLYRYVCAKYPEYNKGENVDLQSYTDKQSISDYAVDAMKWAVAHDIIKGKSETTLCPTDTATRAEGAAMLMRFCEEIGK